MSLESPLKIGVVSSSFSANVREIPRLSRMAGFDGLEFDVVSPLIDLTELSDTGQREFRHLLGAENQQLAALRIDVGAKGLSLGADVDQVISKIDRAMQATRKLAAPTLCVELGLLPPSSTPAKAKPKITPELAGLIIVPSLSDEPSEPAASAPRPNPAFTDQVRRAMGQVGELADRYSVVLAFRSELSGYASLVEVLRGIDCPWFGVDLDPVGMLKDDWSTDEIFSGIGPLARHVRARDALVGSDRRTKPTAIGQGNVDWRQLRRLLDDAEFNGWISIDPLELNDRAAGATAGLKQLRAIFM